ncbi:hypothetical protein [Ectobacillus panaciterrae]|uniref:hypothetical protein n=1 Tax=Ectobacillus panaciterrae TaxID=363872 RepID=UPI000688215D|nr:hypothetical protein [Ectobacillus panaciterrae]
MGCGCFSGFSHRSRRSARTFRSHISHRSFRNLRSNGIVGFLKRLSPGTCVVLQFDDRRPATGTFQGFENGTVILTNFDGFPGLVRIKVKSINAVSVAGSSKCR